MRLNNNDKYEIIRVLRNAPMGMILSRREAWGRGEFDERKIVLSFWGNIIEADPKEWEQWEMDMIKEELPGVYKKIHTKSFWDKLLKNA